MLRRTLLLAAAGLATLTAGCRMCAHPYDYCGPTSLGEGCLPCVSTARACSILSPQIEGCCNAEPASDVIYSVPYGETVGQTSATEEPIATAATERSQRADGAAPASVQ